MLFGLKWLKLENESSINFLIQYGTPQKNKKVKKKRLRCYLRLINIKICAIFTLFDPIPQIQTVAKKIVFFINFTKKGLNIHWIQPYQKNTTLQKMLPYCQKRKCLNKETDRIFTFQQGI